MLFSATSTELLVKVDVVLTVIFLPIQILLRRILILCCLQSYPAGRFCFHSEHSRHSNCRAHCHYPSAASLGCQLSRDGHAQKLITILRFIFVGDYLVCKLELSKKADGNCVLLSFFSPFSGSTEQIRVLFAKRLSNRHSSELPCTSISIYGP